MIVPDSSTDTHNLVAATTFNENHPSDSSYNEVKSVASTVSLADDQTNYEMDNSYLAKLFNINNFSSFNRIVNVYNLVLRFVRILKQRIGKPCDNRPNANLAVNALIRNEQYKYHRDIFEFFKARNLPIKAIPYLVLQMNLFLDSEGLIRVKSKMKTGPHPIFLPCLSHLTTLIIREVHSRFSHAGLYTTLKEVALVVLDPTRILNRQGSIKKLCGL